MPDNANTAEARAVQDSTRVRVILDCNWRDLQHALDMVIEAEPMFSRHIGRIGWGWHFSRRDKPTIFVRLTKRGYSATDTTNV
jgi:hypothetical protein